MAAFFDPGHNSRGVNRGVSGGNEVRLDMIVGGATGCGFQFDPATHSDLIPATYSNSIPAIHSEMDPATYSDRIPATP